MPSRTESWLASRRTPRTRRGTAGCFYGFMGAGGSVKSCHLCHRRETPAMPEAWCGPTTCSVQFYWSRSRIAKAMGTIKAGSDPAPQRGRPKPESGRAARPPVAAWRARLLSTWCSGLDLDVQTWHSGYNYDLPVPQGAGTVSLIRGRSTRPRRRAAGGPGRHHRPRQHHGGLAAVQPARPTCGDVILGEEVSCSAAGRRARPAPTGASRSTPLPVGDD